MRTLLKILAAAAAVALVALCSLVGWIAATDAPTFDVAAPELRASASPEVIARGDYLVNAVAHCADCHGSDLSGGEPIVVPFGTFRPGNLTPDPKTGVGSLSDPELARLIRHAVRPDGALSPFMKIVVGGMSDPDLVAVISYLRVLKPVRKDVPANEVNLIGDALLTLSLGPSHKTAPPFAAPSETPSVERGRYLAEGPANCVGCHTNANPFADMTRTNAAFSGGGPHQTQAAIFIPPNLTPAGPMADLDEDAFVARFRAGPAWPDTMMPWDSYRQMTDADLRSLHRFLASLAPVENDPGPVYTPSPS
jgi:mono/diheme cytochrome c family protein